MSDGPHRSLPRRRPWKEVAKRADQAAYDLDQVVEAVVYALKSDWRNEVSGPLLTAVKKVFVGPENSLRFPEIAREQLDAAKPLAAGSVFGENLISWCDRFVSEGRIDGDAFYEAVGCAAKERGFAGKRQLEEHYLREAGRPRSNGVGARLESALSGISEKSLGATLVERQAISHSRPKKLNDLNDGVLLP